MLWRNKPPPSSSTQLTGKTGSSKTLVPFYQITWHNTPANHNLGVCVSVLSQPEITAKTMCRSNLNPVAKVRSWVLTMVLIETQVSCHVILCPHNVTSQKTWISNTWSISSLFLLPFWLLFFKAVPRCLKKKICWDLTVTVHFKGQSSIHSIQQFHGR